MVFPSSEVSSSLSYNNTQPLYALVSGYALGRHKVNGGIPDGGTLLLYASKLTVVCEDILLLFMRLTVDYLMCTMLNRVQTLYPSAIRTSFPLLSFHRTSLKPCLNYVLASALP